MEKLLGSAETAVPASRLGRRSLKPSPPPGERPPIVFLRDEAAELLGLGPRGSPGRHTVRAQLSWRSWGKFCDLRRGPARSAGPSPPAAPPRGGWGPGPPGRGGTRGQAGMNGRPPSAPRLCSPLLPPRPPLPHCLLRGCAGPEPNFEGASIPGLGGAAARQRHGCPSCAPSPRGAWTPRLGASPGRLLRGRGASAAQWIPLIRPSPRTSAGDASKQLSGADAGGKHAGHRPPLGGAFGVCQGPARVGGVQPRRDPLWDRATGSTLYRVQMEPYFETKQSPPLFF